MSDRTPGHYWVVDEEGHDPQPAYWDGMCWTFAESDYGGARSEIRVHRVGFGCVAPTDGWEPDFPPPRPRQGPPTKSDAMMTGLIDATLRRSMHGIAADLEKGNALSRYFAKKG